MFLKYLQFFYEKCEIFFFCVLETCKFILKQADNWLIKMWLNYDCDLNCQGQLIPGSGPGLAMQQNLSLFSMSDSQLCFALFTICL